jgi:uncharacterized protein YkwD
MKRIALLLSLLAAPVGAAAPSAADEMLAAFQTQLESGGDNFGVLFGTIEELPLADQRALLAEIDQIWPRTRQAYLTALTQTARSVASNRGDSRQAVRTHRAEFMRVYALPEDRMKPLLSEVSMPAINELRKLLIPEPEHIISAGGDPLLKQRKLAAALADFRDATLNAMLSSTPSDSRSGLQAAEKEAAESIAGFERNGLRVLEQNRKIAAANKVPEEEARGIEECNILRMLVGLHPLALDPRLCDAARDHSKDMAEHGFFAHESPLPGKTSPGDRAKNFRTTCSGENIFMGSPSANAANMGWFYSPGHHKNMFSAGHQRIGLGNHGRHWTQKFGR